MLTIFDSHWLPYRNAEVRAFALDNKTIPLDFYNVTDDETEGDNVGRVVNTDERGFLHYGGGSGLQNVECLAVKESAVIQVSRPTGEILGQWVLKTGQRYLTTADLGTLTYSDGTLAFDPTVPREWKLRNFALASDVRKGIWQEAQTAVFDADAATAKLSKWQSVIYIPETFTGNSLALDASPLLADDEPRFGLKFLVVNGSDHNVEVQQAGVTSGSKATIPAGGQVCACAVFSLHTAWTCALAFDDTPAALQQAVSTLNAKDTEIEQNVSTLTTRVMGLRYMPLTAQVAHLTATTSSEYGTYAWHLAIQNDTVMTPFVWLDLTAEVIDNLTPWQPWDTGTSTRQIDISWPAAESAVVQIWINVSLQHTEDKPIVITYNGVQIANRDSKVSTDNITVGEIFTAQRMTKGNVTKTVLTQIATKVS